MFISSQIIVGQAAAGRIFLVQDVPPEKVVIVLGASVLSSGQPSDMLADRLLTALEIYQAGKAEKFLLSGDHGQVDYNEVDTMKNFLVAKGVPEGDIVLDHAGFDTFDTMVRAHEVFLLDSAIVVTQKYHLPRALYLGQTADMEVFGVAADRQTYIKMPYFIFREYLARVKAVLEVWFQAEPKYLGETIPIN
ncbi:MAG: ElyC/SanA/YdcF family protein [Candidatus Uhrbacteria bacterium]